MRKTHRLHTFKTLAMNEMKSSELVLNPSGKPYHININGDELADDIFLFGDPNRVYLFKKLNMKVVTAKFIPLPASITGTASRR